MQELTVLKVGGSVITKKDSQEPEVDWSNLRRIASEIAEWYFPEKRLVLVHGAGSYGHGIVKKTGIHKGIKTEEQKNAFAETQRLQNELNAIVCKELIKKGVPAFPVQASASAVMNTGKLEKMNHEVVEGLVNAGIVPVLYGVPAYDKKQICSILSGDVIAPYLAEKLGAKLMIHGTNVNGVYSSDPRKNPNSEQIPEISPENWEEILNKLGGSSDTDVTGGMRGKVSEAYSLARKGIKSVITDVTVPGNLLRALNGEDVGTIIR